MLVVLKNTYPEVDLLPGDLVEWVFQRSHYSLYRYPYKGLLDKSCFTTPSCTREGIKSNGKRVDLVGVVGQLKSRGYVLELGEYNLG